MFHRITFLVLALIALCSPPQVATAETLDSAIEAAVKKIVELLHSEDEDSIAIGVFNGPPQLVSSAGPGIAQKFVHHFESHKIKPSRRAKIGLKGDFAFRKVESGVAVEIRCSLLDSFGETISDLTIAGSDSGVHSDANQRIHLPPVDDHSDIALLTGATVELHPEDSDRDHSKDIAKSIENPSFFCDGTLICASKNSPFGFEILVDNRPIPIHEEDGMPFVNIPSGKSYALRVYNKSKIETAITISIDGLSVFDFSELRDDHGKPLYTYYILSATNSPSTYRGWHRDDHTVDSFKVTDYSRSAAAKANIQPGDSSIGTITIRFHSSWGANDQPPPDEMTTKGGNATGFGASVQQKTQKVQRNIGRLRSSISVRYTK